MGFWETADFVNQSVKILTAKCAKESLRFRKVLKCNYFLLKN